MPQGPPCGYPFGWLQPNRKWNNPDYRYGFNEEEKDDEWSGNGNNMDFGARVLDSRVGRWLSVDPLTKEYPSHSSYSFALNKPITCIDRLGESVYLIVKKYEFDENYNLIWTGGLMKIKVTKDFNVNQLVEEESEFQLLQAYGNAQKVKFGDLGFFEESTSEDIYIFVGDFTELNAILEEQGEKQGRATGITNTEFEDKSSNGIVDLEELFTTGEQWYREGKVYEQIYGLEIEDTDRKNYFVSISKELLEGQLVRRGESLNELKKLNVERESVNTVLHEVLCHVVFDYLGVPNDKTQYHDIWQDDLGDDTTRSYKDKLYDAIDESMGTDE
ncbi:MAG: hypothetical protein H6581_21480 [Bacteroidia bacterium]|nr:hypothetical protein [Bacteroidia bacterium]